MSTRAEATVEASTGPRMQLGRYRLLGEIGRGGMAEVWLASTSGLAGVHKLLVVKRLKRGLEDEPNLITMLLDEARIAARLGHPNVVQTYEVDVDDGLPFIAMEYLDGQPMHRILRRFGSSGLARDAQLWILAELLRGLHHAHELRDYNGRPLRVVHRDVNPQNVFVTYHGAVKLMDFGIAKAMDSVAQTEVGMLKGKLAYMAPEQAKGSAELDRRVDLFAVGVMMWEALTGERMWGGRSDIEIATALSEGWVPPLPSRPEIPERLGEICTRAIATRPEERWPDAQSLHDALRTWLDDEGRPPSPAALGRAVADHFSPERERRAALVRSYGQAQGTWSRETWDSTRDHSHNDETRRITPPVAAAGHPPPLSTLDGRRPRYLPHLVVALLVGGLGLGIGGYLQAPTPAEHRPPPKEASAAAPPSAQTGSPPSAQTGSPPSPWAVSPAATAPDHTCVRTGEPVELTGDLEDDAILSCDKIYLIRYIVRVRSGVTLTIEPGTVILGDPATRGTLVIQPGGQLVAEGRPDAPIVFTSAQPEAKRRPGDWGGLLVLGRAPINLRDHRGQPIQGQVEGITRGGRYGGDDPDDSSGSLRYLRIEYSGVEIGPNNEVNGLTLAGVGRGTTLDHVQVRHTADDCFELFGGTVSGSHLLCDDPGDDGFDWDLGYQGELRFLVVRSNQPGRGQHGIEGDNDPQGDRAEPRSRPRLANVTVCGSPGDPRERFGLLLRHGTDAHVTRALVLGFDAALQVRDPETSWELVDSRLARPVTGRGDRASEVRDDLLSPAHRNATGLPPDLGCHRASIESLIPAAPLSTAVPGAEPGAAYVGAFRDREDRWDASWAVWNDPA